MLEIPICNIFQYSFLVEGKSQNYERQISWLIEI